VADGGDGRPDGDDPSLPLSRRALLAAASVAAATTGVGLSGDGRETMDFDGPYGEERELAVGEEHVAAAGTPWATEAALSVMEDGGNAFDGVVAGLLALSVTFGEAASFPGVAPTLVETPDEDPAGYIGAGKAPEAATVDHFREQGHETMPTMSIESQLLPASPDVAVTLLCDRGTLTFERVVEPAVRLAREGFPVHAPMADNLDFGLLERFGFYLLMPYNVEVYLNGRWWDGIEHGERFRRPDLADTFEAMAGAEREARESGADREAALETVREYFYEGPIAETIVDFHDRAGGLFTREDLAGYEGGWEEPVAAVFGDYTVYANDTWCQGPAFPLALSILDGVDLASMGHNSIEYVHTVVQALDLAMADREAYFGDPEFVDVPLAGLFHPEYAAERRELMTPNRNFPDMPTPGDPYQYDPELDGPPVDREALVADAPTGDVPFGSDTSYVTAADAEGNAVSLTVSDFPQTPMVPGTGLTLGNRMQQFRLDPDHATALEAGKRPRISPNPALAYRDGEFCMAFGTPGGDMQIQAMLQTFLNVAFFDMDLQSALDAYRVKSRNFPNSFAPHGYDPGTVRLERSLAEEVGDGLREKGYDLEVRDDYPANDGFGAVCITARDPETGDLQAVADPRGASWAGAEGDRYF